MNLSLKEYGKQKHQRSLRNLNILVLVAPGLVVDIETVVAVGEGMGVSEKKDDGF